MNIDDARNDSPVTPHSDSETKRPNLSDLGSDVAHPFDQTNGIVEGLEGDADEATDQEGDLLVHPTLDDKAENGRSSEEGRA